MFKNYLKIAFRNLLKHKSYSIINIAGLGVALAVCLTIGLFVRDKLNYDRHFLNADRLYRIIQSDMWGSNAQTPPGLASAVENQYPEIESATVIGYPRRRLFAIGSDPFFVEDILTADEHFFDVFPFRILQGDAAAALAQPNQMVITRSLATFLFGDDNPIGKIVQIDNEADFEIAAIVDDVPKNTHFRFQALVSMSKQRREERYGKTLQWNFWGDYLYVSLVPEADPNSLERQLTAWGKNERTLDSEDWQLTLQPVTAIHLYSEARSELPAQSDINYIYLFSVLAVLVLAIACINYMNLATARYTQRVNEVGIRKVVGASRFQLVKQFIVEAVLVCLLVLPLAVLLVEFALPMIHRQFGVEIAFDLWQHPGILFSFLALIVLVGAGSGSYPGLFLSNLRPVQMLGGRQPGFGSAGLFRKALVVTQFATSLVLLVSTLLIYSQLDYIHNKRLGFEKDYIISFSSSKLGKQYQTFKQALLTSPHIRAVSSGSPTGIGGKTWSTSIPSQDDSNTRFLNANVVDYDYIETMGLRLKAGRSFSKSFPTDIEQAVIVNESAARVLGFADNPLNQYVKVPSSKKKVIGVVEDFHNNSLHSPLELILFELKPRHNYTAIVRLQPGGIEEGLKVLKRTWERFVPDWPFEYQFLSDRLERQYREEERMVNIFVIFSSLAIIIACLGLYGLIAFTAERRTKEIGIRKVLGATVANVTALLSKDFIKLVLVANLIAWPVAWYAMNRWLQGFAYRIDVGWWAFALAGGLALVIALLTVSTQAIKSALANPVEALKYE